MLQISFIRASRSSRITALLWALTVFLLLSGCIPAQKWSIRGSHCINPVEPDCAVDDRDSRPILIRLYPLKSCPPTTLKWVDLSEPDKDRELLADVWMAPPLELVLERTEEKVLPVQSIRPRCTLLMTVGRREGASSLLAVKSRWLRREHALVVDRCDIFLDEDATSRRARRASPSP